MCIKPKVAAPKESPITFREAMFCNPVFGPGRVATVQGEMSV